MLHRGDHERVPDDLAPRLLASLVTLGGLDLRQRERVPRAVAGRDLYGHVGPELLSRDADEQLVVAGLFGLLTKEAIGRELKHKPCRAERGGGREFER